MRKGISGLLFRIICIGFSLCLLVGALMGSIQLAALNEELTDLERELEELKDNQHMLQAKYESSLSLEELEHYATEELGMQTLKPSQIFYIDLG